MYKLWCHKSKVMLDSRVGKVLLLWESSKKTSSYHWWPMKETSFEGNDVDNNLYASEGGLDKYDKLFGSKSVEYQKREYFRSHNSKCSDAGWAGFCDLATTLSCLYRYPRHGVKVRYGDKECLFMRKNIESLMIVACQNSIQRWKTVYYGERNDGIRGDDKQEPYPTQLLEILRKICQNDSPFGMDIESGCAVWNYAFDKVQVYEEYDYPKKFNKKVEVEVPKTGNTSYYNFVITSVGFSCKNQNIWGWVNNTDGVITQNWLSKWHPDFLWRKFAKEGTWDGDCIMNQEIDARKVYKIYKRSVSDNEEVLIF